jgi:hypothetical protein
MIDLTRYSKIFGEPKKGIHSTRIFGLAAVDLGLTVLAAFILSSSLKWNFWVTLLGLVVLGIGIHGLFGVNTQLNEWLGLNKNVK